MMGGSGLSRLRELTPETEECVPEGGLDVVPDRRRDVLDRRCSETSSSSSGSKGELSTLFDCYWSS